MRKVDSGGTVKKQKKSRTPYHLIHGTLPKIAHLASAFLVKTGSAIPVEILVCRFFVFRGKK